MKIIIKILQKHRLLALVGMRLVQITGKSKQRIHPKHLVKINPWYLDYTKKSDYVLDYGCGSGQHSIKVAKKVKKVIAFDYDEKSLEIAKYEATSKKLKNIIFKKINGEEKLPFQNNQFDKVIFIDVLEHLNNRNRALSEIHRVLKNKGIALISVPNVDTSWKKLQKRHNLFYYTDPDHKIEYTKKQICKLLTGHHFKIEELKLGLWDTPLSGVFDMVGGLSLSFYKNLRQIRVNYVVSHPQEADGFNIVAVARK